MVSDSEWRTTALDLPIYIHFGKNYILYSPSLQIEIFSSSMNRRMFWGPTSWKEGHTAFKPASLTTGKEKLEEDFSLESLLYSDVRMGDFALLTLTI